MNEAVLKAPQPETSAQDEPGVKQMLLLLSASVATLQLSLNDVQGKVIAIDERTSRMLSIVDPQLKTPTP